MAKKILKITVTETTDPDGSNVSYLGKYSDQWKPGAFDRKHTADCAVNSDANRQNRNADEDEDDLCTCNHCGPYERGEFRYFIPADNEYAKEAYKRMEQISGGDVSSLFIQAEAQVKFGTIIQTIVSGGVSGVESDDEESIVDAKEFTLDELSEELLEMGFDENEIQQAVNNAK